jgi:nitronate monooxygenase
MLEHYSKLLAERISMGRKVLFNVEKAFIAAPMAGGITTPEFVAGVSNAGGIGSFATGYLSPQQVKESIERIQQLTTEKFSANVFVPQKIHYDEKCVKKIQAVLKPYYDAQQLSMPDPETYKLADKYYNEILDVLYEAQIPILSFTFGCLSPEIIKKFHAIGTKIMGTATTPAEAVFLANHGCDAIMAQGIEAGGHRGSFLDDPHSCGMGLMSLIPAIKNIGVKIPIFAAGGIATSEQALAAIILGANGFSSGTALLLAQESGANVHYKHQLQETNGQTHLTPYFTGKPVRCLQPNELENILHQAHIAPPDYPIAHVLTQPLRKSDPERFGAFWAGQSNILSSQAFSGLPVKEIVNALYQDITH